MADYSVADSSICQFTFQGTMYGQQVMNVFSYRLDNGGVDLPNAAAAAQGVMTTMKLAGNFWPVWLAALSQDVIHCELSAQWIKPVRYNYINGNPAADSGTRLTNGMSANYAAAFLRRGLTAGRHSVSVTHMFGLIPDDVVNGLVSDTYGVLLNNVMDQALQTRVIGGTGELVPCAYNRADYLSSRPLYDGHVQATLRVQRRRTVGVGK